MVYRRVACFLLGSALYYWELAGEWKVGRAEKWEERRGEERREEKGTDAPRRRKRDARKALCFCFWVCVHAFPLGVVFACRSGIHACLVE